MIEPEEEFAYHVRVWRRGEQGPTVEGLLHGDATLMGELAVALSDAGSGIHLDLWTANARTHPLSDVLSRLRAV